MGAVAFMVVSEARHDVLFYSWRESTFSNTRASSKTMAGCWLSERKERHG